jgi:hypothetical protein
VALLLKQNRDKGEQESIYTGKEAAHGDDVFTQEGLKNKYYELFV